MQHPLHRISRGCFYVPEESPVGRLRCSLRPWNVDWLSGQFRICLHLWRSQPDSAGICSAAAKIVVILRAVREYALAEYALKEW